MTKVNYKIINHNLTKRYYNYLKNQIVDLKCKAYGEYFGGTKYTKNDQDRYEILTNKLRKLQKYIFY